MLVQYEKIASITGSMMEAARRDDWGTALELGQQYCEAVEALRHDDGQPVLLTPQQRTAKRDLLVRILEHDAVTRDLAVPQLARLSTLLGRLKRQQSLLHTYGADHTYAGSEAHLP